MFLEKKQTTKTLNNKGKIMNNSKILKFLINNKKIMLMLLSLLLFYLYTKTHITFLKPMANATLCLVLDIIFDSEVSRSILTLLVFYNIYKVMSCFF